MNGGHRGGGVDHHGGSGSGGLPLVMALHDGTAGPQPARGVTNRFAGGKTAIQCAAGHRPVRVVGNSRSDGGKPQAASLKDKKERIDSFFVRRNRAKPEGQQTDSSANSRQAGGTPEGEGEGHGGGARARCHQRLPTHQLFNISIAAAQGRTPARLGDHSRVAEEAGETLCGIRDATPGGDGMVDIPLLVTPDASSAEGKGRPCTPPPASSPSDVANVLAGLQLVGDAESGDKEGDGDHEDGDDGDHGTVRCVVRESNVLDVRAVDIALEPSL